MELYESNQTICKKSGEKISDEDITLIGCLHGECRHCPYLNEYQLKIERANYKLLQEYGESILIKTLKNVLPKKSKKK